MLNAMNITASSEAKIYIAGIIEFYFVEIPQQKVSAKFPSLFTRGSRGPAY